MTRLTPGLGPSREGVSRRRLLQMAAALFVAGPSAALAQAKTPIADVHSHYGMVTRTMADSGLAADMRSQGVVLVAWKAIADQSRIHRTTVGIEQKSEPGPGDLARHFESTLGRMKAYVASEGLKTVLTPADVDACLAGEPGIVLACEGADFLEGRVEALDAAYARGLRHLQLVHYIRTPVGDFQTSSPRHGGLSAMGRALVQACNAKGVLVDLAHSTGAGEGWSVNDYAGVRAVVDRLQGLKLGSSVVERVAYRNYARVLKAALTAA